MKREADVQSDALRERLEAVEIPENARKVADYLLTNARRRTPLWEQWRIVNEVERIIREYGTEERA
jgi:hypothetical protein